MITTTLAVGATLNSSVWFNSPPLTVPAGTYIFFHSAIVQPGSTSTLTFSNLIFVIATGNNNVGTNYYYCNDTTTRLTLVYGSANTYATLQKTGVITLSSSQSLYASIQLNYTTGGSNLSGVTDGGYITYLRIA